VLLTGLTGVSPLWDLSQVNCLVRVSLVVLLLVSSCPVWSCFARLCEGFFFLAGCVLGVFLFQRLEKALRLSGTFVVRLL
jgi:hypothetical protein